MYKRYNHSYLSSIVSPFHWETYIILENKTSLSFYFYTRRFMFDISKAYAYRIFFFFY